MKTLSYPECIYSPLSRNRLKCMRIIYIWLKQHPGDVSSTYNAPRGILRSSFVPEQDEYKTKAVSSHGGIHKQSNAGRKLIQPPAEIQRSKQKASAWSAIPHPSTLLITPTSVTEHAAGSMTNMLGTLLVFSSVCLRLVELWANSESSNADRKR